MGTFWLRLSRSSGICRQRSCQRALGRTRGCRRSSPWCSRGVWCRRCGRPCPVRRQSRQEGTTTHRAARHAQARLWPSSYPPQEVATRSSYKGLRNHAYRQSCPGCGEQGPTRRTRLATPQARPPGFPKGKPRGRDGQRPSNWRTAALGRRGLDPETLARNVHPFPRRPAEGRAQRPASLRQDWGRRPSQPGGPETKGFCTCQTPGCQSQYQGIGSKLPPTLVGTRAGPYTRPAYAKIGAGKSVVYG